MGEEQEEHEEQEEEEAGVRGVCTCVIVLEAGEEEAVVAEPRTGRLQSVAVPPYSKSPPPPSPRTST